MASRLFLSDAASVGPDGAAVFKFGPVPLGFVWTGSVSIPEAPPAATFTVDVLGTPWGSWAGPAPSPQVQAHESESIAITAAGLTPASSSLQAGAGTGVFSAQLTGLLELESEAAPIAPAPIVPLFGARHLGGHVTAGAKSGSFTVAGLQPSDHFLIVACQDTPGLAGTVESSSTAVVYGVYAMAPETFAVVSVIPVFESTAIVTWSSLDGDPVPAAGVINVYASPVAPEAVRKAVRSTHSIDNLVGDHTLLAPPALVRLLSISFAVTSAGVSGGTLVARNAITGASEVLAGIACTAALGAASLFANLDRYTAGAGGAVIPLTWHVSSDFLTADVFVLYEDLEAA